MRAVCPSASSRVRKASQIDRSSSATRIFAMLCRSLDRIARRGGRQLERKPRAAELRAPGHDEIAPVRVRDVAAHAEPEPEPERLAARGTGGELCRAFRRESGT